MIAWLKGLTAARPAERVEPTISNTTSFLSSDTEAWNNLLPGGLAGSVSPATAMRHAAVYRCVSLIAFSIAMLPLKTYKDLPSGDRETATQHWASYMLRKRPNTRMSRSVFWRQLAAQMLLRGNGIAWIERKGSGIPLNIWPIPFERVHISLNGDRLRYQMQLDDGRIITVDQDDVLHFPGSPEWDGLKAKTPIQAMASSVGIGIEADRFARKYFENDATPPGYIAYPTGFKSKPEEKDELRAFWKRSFGGENRHSGPAILTDGGKYEQIPLSAEDAQLLETRRYQIEDIARIFGVPRFLLGMDETSWGSGIEALGIGYVTYTLDPHLVAVEDEIDFKLFPRSPFFGEFDRDVLLRGNIESRYKAYQLALGGSSGPGHMTPNEVRRRQNLPARPDGDKLAGWAAKEQQPAKEPKTTSEQQDTPDA